ncbi:MAG: hypothetical protein WBE26_07550 [Phycisphaerae bacterium]
MDGLAFDYDKYFAPLPKFAACPDIFDRDGFLLGKYAGLGYVEIDTAVSCYRPTYC